MKTRNVFWSGGIDSTFIVTQLSQFPVTIRPFYIKGQTFRLSEPWELSATAEIRDLLLSDTRTKAEILPLEVVEKDDRRVKDRDIVNAHRRIYTRLLEGYKEQRGGSLPPAGSQQIYADGAFISPQYLSFASLAKFYGQLFEVGLLRDDFEIAPSFKKLHTVIETDELTQRGLLRAVDDTPDKDFYELFKLFRFPIAGQHMYKKDVWDWYKHNSYEHIRAKTIFCQSPVSHNDGTFEPCGICNSCITVIHENVLEPFTPSGLERNRDYEENHEKEPERFRLKAFSGQKG